MKKTMTVFVLTAALLTNFVSSARSRSFDNNFVGSNKWVGHTLGNQDGGINSFNCSGRSNFVTAIRFRRYRKEDRDADFYTFAVVCAQQNRDSARDRAFKGYLPGSLDFIGEHVISCHGYPMNGVGMYRYHKKDGDIETYQFAAKCRRKAGTAGKYYELPVGSTRGSFQDFHVAECALDAPPQNDSIMYAFHTVRYRQSKGDRDSYRIGIGCRY